MEEKNNENNESKSKFQAVKNKDTYTKYLATPKSSNNFGKAVVVPFISGVLGCSLVLGTCFGIPSVKEKLIGTDSTVATSSTSSTSSENGTVNFVSLSDYSDTSVYAASKILPSIVGIKIEFTVSSAFSFFGTAQSSTGSASGSGIIISEDGYILTNNHVVDASSESSSYYELSSATKVTVKLYNDDQEYEAKIIGQDSQTDLAVIKIDATGLTAAEFADSDSLKVGEFVMAAGNPLGLDFSITCGVVSALNREITDSDGKTFTLIQTDAAINSGNSGGALVNSEGKVVGINTLKVSSTGVEGMGFAIPINSTTDVTSQLIQYNKVKRPYIGITGVSINEQTAKQYNLVVGVYVKSVEEFSAAEKAGIQVGDVITSFDGKTVTTMDELTEIKNTHSIGDEVKLKVNRNGSEKELTISLGEEN